MALDRRLEAISSWDEAIVAAKVADGEGQQDLSFYFEVQRARCLAVEDAAKGVEALEAISGLLDSDYQNKQVVLYNAATVYVAALADSEAEQRPQFLEKVFECLTFLETSGYFSDLQNMENLQGDAEFEPVLETPELRALLERVRKN